MLNQSQIDEATKCDCCYRCKYFYNECEELITKEMVFKVRVCRKNPPKPDGHGFGRFPIVGITDWCGSFCKKEVNYVRR